MKHATRLACGTLALVVVFGAHQARGASPAPSRAGATLAASATAARAALDTYCVGCHNEQRKAQYRNLALDTLDPADPGSNAGVWELVVRKLRAGTMPPAGMPRPTRDEYRSLVASLEAALDRAAEDDPNPGRPLIHRLNRAEYINAVRDLLEVDVSGLALLPADNSSYGFDNIADVLTMSPGLLDRYVAAARKVSRAALGASDLPPNEAVYLVSALAIQEDRAGDDLPFGTRGGTAVRHHFPLDAEYVIKIDLQLDLSGRIRGRHEDNQIDVRIDGVRVKQFVVPKSAPPGSGPDPAAGMTTLHVRVPVTAGMRQVVVALVKRRTVVSEGIGPGRLPIGSTTYGTGNATTVEAGRIEMGIGAVRIEGPLEGKVPQRSATRRRLFVCQPAAGTAAERCAKTILSTLARRAYRRPATAAEVETLMEFFRTGRTEGGFDAGIQHALERVLVAPAFLFRIERSPKDRGGIHRVGDYDLAARLSFFLWSSIPDDELLDLASRGRLKDPAVLTRQVERMLVDSRSKAFVINFFGQWLQLRNVQSSAPDPKEYPEFDDSLRDAFQRETELFLESQLRDDRSVLDLLTADYTFLNERLARHYGVQNVYGGHFRRVPVADGRRRGLFGQGSILMVTSYADRTSPVLRGKWLLENILGTPAPEPPPNVPPFPANDGKTRPKSVRARMEMHRQNPVCAACHSQLDPMGFGLENFDAIGQWREIDAGTPIDASGAFPNGTKFNGPEALKQGLLDYREEFLATVVRKLMTYALGRGVEPYDMPAIRKIIRTTASTQHRWSSLVLGIVRSVPFQMRISEP